MGWYRCGRSRDRKPDHLPPFPKQQLFVLAICRLCEPIAFMSIFPYIYYMVKSFNISHDDSQIAIYTGMVTSAFAFAEFSASVFWGKLSDHVGRKPILLMGLAGTGISMMVFGFATNLPVALAARALGGLLNGNIGVLQTTVAEVVPVKEHQPRAFTIMPFVWCLGSIIGSGLGGFFADPVHNYPDIFPTGTILDKFPYLLPNLISALVVLVGLVVGILFLEETHEKKKLRRDPGLELGRWIIRRLKSRDEEHYYSKLADANLDENTALVDPDQRPPSYDSSETASSIKSVHSNVTAVEDEGEAGQTASKPSAKKAITTQVLLNVVSYGILAYHTIAFEQLLPVMLSMKTSEDETRLPFKFSGGFGLPTSTIGFVLSMQGVYQMVAQMILFPAIVGRLGPLRTFRFTALTYPLLYVIVPYLVLLPSGPRMLGLGFVLLWKVTHQALSYPSNLLLLTNSAPSFLVLGFINGVAAAAASLARAIGPTVSGLIQSAGLKVGYLGVPWWASAAMALLGAVESLLLKDAQPPPQRRRS